MKTENRKRKSRKLKQGSPKSYSGEASDLSLSFLAAKVKRGKTLSLTVEKCKECLFSNETELQKKFIM